jgi:hypothetical protein
MPTISDLPSEVYTRSKFLDNLPRHRTLAYPAMKFENEGELAHMLEEL